MSEVLVLVDHVGGTVRKTTNEMLTIARRLGEPSAVFIGAAVRRGRRGAEAVRRREDLRRRPDGGRALPGHAEGRGAGPAGRVRLARPRC